MRSMSVRNVQNVTKCAIGSWIRDGQLKFDIEDTVGNEGRDLVLDISSITVGKE